MEGPHDMEAGFPPEQVIQEGEQGGGHGTFYDLMCKVTHHDSHLVLFIRSESLSPAHTQGEEH